MTSVSVEGGGLDIGWPRLKVTKSLRTTPSAELVDLAYTKMLDNGVVYVEVERSDGRHMRTRVPSDVVASNGVLAYMLANHMPDDDTIYIKTHVSYPHWITLVGHKRAVRVRAWYCDLPEFKRLVAPP